MLGNGWAAVASLVSKPGSYGGEGVQTIHTIQHLSSGAQLAAHGTGAHAGGEAGFSHTETYGDLPPGFKMEGGKMVYSKGGSFDFSSGDKLPPGFHLSGGDIVYGQGSHAMSFPESDFHTEGGHVVFSDADSTMRASGEHAAHSSAGFSHTETYRDLPPGFKMEGGKMVYSKGGSFDFSSGDKLPPGFHLNGGDIVYGQGSHAMSFPESDFHTEGGHVVFSDADSTMRASGGHAAHSSAGFSHTETYGDLPPGFKMEGGKMVYSKGGSFDFSSGDKLPPGFHLNGGDIVYGQGSHAMSFPESDFHTEGGHVVFSDADSTMHGSAAATAKQHGGAGVTHVETRSGDLQFPPGFQLEGGKMVWTKGGNFDFDGTGRLPPGFRVEGNSVVYGHGSSKDKIPIDLISKQD